MTNKVLLKRTSSASLEQIATDVSSSVTIDSYKILKSLDIIIFDGDDQDRLFTEISALELGSVSKDHTNFEFHATRSTYVPGTDSGNRYWQLDAISRLDYDDGGSNLGTFSTRSDGEDVDIYVIDSGVQGASRPTGSGAALHPEFFHPDYTNLSSATSQGYYRVYSLPTSLFNPGTTNGNEPQTTGNSTQRGHGTYCAMMAAGRYSGVANKANIYSLRVSDDTGVIQNSKMLEAFDAIYRHNDPTDSDFKGNTLDGNTRPRSSVVNVSIGLNSPTPEFPFMGRNENYVGQTRNFTVSNNGASDYTFSGSDATTTHTNANDPTLTVTKGDKLVMNLSASGHPFLVNDANGAFAGATTTSGDNQTGEVTIDTSQISSNSGTLTYVCQFHGAMTGSIVVQEANLASSNFDELYGDAEARISSLPRVTLCRSAGNGMTWTDAGEVYRDYGPKNTKITYGARDAGYQSFLDPEISITNKSNETYGATDKFTVGATRLLSNRQTFATFTNYGEAVTCYAPGQNLYCPVYDWTIDTPTSGTNYSGSPHASISGTSFSTPLLAGMIAVWRDVYDGASGANGQERVEDNAEKKLSFVDITASTPTQVGFQNTVRTSAGAATTYFMTTNADDTAKRSPISTTNGSSNVVLSLHDALFTALNPQQGDIFEFEFPRVEDPGTRNPTTLVADERKKDTFNLGEVVKYEVTVNNNVFELARVQNGVAGTPSAQPVIALEQGVVYRFIQTDPSNLTHPFDISPNSDGTHSGGDTFITHFTNAALNPKHCMRYVVAGQGEVDRTAYDAAVGGGVECYIEFIDPRGDTHPDVPASAVSASYFYYCKTHAGLGAELTTSATVTEATIGGISLADFCSKWRTVTATDAVNKTITFTADTNATGTEQGGGGIFNKADSDLFNDGRPRWPMRFTKIEGTFFENDAIYEWINNYSNVVRSGTDPDGNAFVAGKLWAQLETEEYSGGVQIENFPVAKSRLPKEYIDRDTSSGDPSYVLRFSGNRWGSGPRSNGRTEGSGITDSLVRMYEPVATGTTSLTYDGGQGIFFPFIDLNAAYSITPALSGAGYANGSTVSSTISTVITTFAGEDPEPFMTKEYELVDVESSSPFTLSGSVYTITGSGLSFDSSTGVLSGTTTSSANDATYAIRVKEKVSQGTADYSWTNTGTNNATISIDTQPTAAVGDGSYPVDSGTTTFTVVASASDSGSLNYAWQYATTQAEVNNNQWTAVPSTGVFIGASGANTATLTIPDSTAISGYFFTCLVSAAAGNASPVRTQTRDFTATVTLTSNAWFTVATQYATQVGNGGSKVEVEATFSDGTTPSLSLGYVSADGTETGIVSNSNNYALVATGSNGSNGFPEYNVRLGKVAIGGFTRTDSGETFQVVVSHPASLVSPTTIPTTSSAITVNDAYSVGTDLPSTGSVNQDTAYSLTVTFSNLASGSGVANPVIVWTWDAGQGPQYLTGSESWYTSGIGTGTLSFTPSLSMSGYVFQAFAYHDFTGQSAGTGGQDLQALQNYSGIGTSLHALTVIQTQVGPAIRIVKPNGVSADNSLSDTNSTFSTSEYLLTITSDMLPDPATHGPHPNSSNPNTTSAQNLNHTIRYRGGTNSPSLTPWSLGTLGLAANGVALFNPSAGTGALPGSTDAPPPGFEYNAVHNEAYYGVDTAGGHPESNGEYHYHSGKFLFSGDWSAVAKANGYYGDTNYNNDNFRHADGHSKIIGWAFDGHPIYGPWGYTNANDNTSSPTRMTSSFSQLITDTHRPVGSKYTDTITVNGQSVTLTAGSFLQDFTYSPGSGTLDSSNGRYGVTPEYPNGTYAYFITVDSSNVPEYPYIFGTSLRQAYYQPGSAFVPSDPGGTNTNGPSNGGFNPNTIWVKGMTVLAKTGGDNGREITVDNLTPGSGAHTYQWQKSSDNGQNWSDIAASENGFSGETNTTLTIKDNSSAVDDLMIRLKLTDAGSAVSYSEFIPLQYVGSTLSISAQPADTTIVSGQTATFSVTAATTDDITLTYQWQESSDNGSTWVAINGETNTTLSLSGIQTPASNTGYQYRVQVASSSATNSPLTSDAAVLTVSQGSITVDTQPTSQTVNEGSDATFSVGISTNSGLPITYLWERSDDQGTSWTTVAGETSSSLTVSGTTYADDNDDYYRVTGSIAGLGSIQANAVILTIQRTLAISTQPTDQTVYDTQNVTFSVATTVSSGTATYQWEESTDSGANWSTIAGAVNNAYTISNVANSASGNQYRVIVSLVGSAGDITSNAATLTVNARPTLAIVSQPQDQTRYQPDTANFTITANASDASVITYQWEKSDDSGTTWTPLAGETTNSYTSPATVTANDNGDQYRVVISHPAATNSPITSNVATLTVLTPVITFTLQPQSISTTAGVPVTFSANSSVTSSRTITYLWQVSSDQGSNWIDIPGSISNNLSVTGDASNNGYYYRLKANSEGAAVAYSNSAILTLQFIANPSISASGFVDPITNKTFVRQPRIDSSLFISYLGNGHASSFWRITRTSDNFIVYTTAVDVGAAGDTGQKIEFLTPVLDWNETYTVEVRYRDSAGFDSAWSSPVSFTTPVADQPIFNLPIETSLRPTINLNTVIYDTVNFTHTSTDWQIADDATFNTIIYEALTDTTNLTSLEVPANVVLNSSTNYYVRARINVT
jgi:hypothetical protein